MAKEAVSQCAVVGGGKKNQHVLLGEKNNKDLPGV